MSGIFDTHAHYTAERFDTEFEGGADALLKLLFEGDVEKILNVSTTTKNSLEAVEMAARYEGMYAAVGVHPTDIGEENNIQDAMHALSALLEERVERKIVAIGEIGLDYYWTQDNKEIQKQYFLAQLTLAEQYDLPVLIHDRDAHGDTFETILKYPKVRGVLHSYSGSAEMARELVKRGWYISFSGVVTFKNARSVRAVAESIPLDRLLVETDAPYLAPEPNRGKLNRSDYIAFSLETLADLHGVSVEEMRDITNQNACRLFGIS